MLQFQDQTILRCCYMWLPFNFTFSHLLYVDRCISKEDNKPLAFLCVFIHPKKLCLRHSFNLESVLNQTVSMTASFWNTFLKQFLMNKLWWWCMYSFFSTFFVWDLGDEMSCWVLATLLLFMSKLTCSSFYMEFNYTIKMPKDSLTLQNPLMALFVGYLHGKKKGRVKSDFFVSSIQSWWWAFERG